MKIGSCKGSKRLGKTELVKNICLHKTIKQEKIVHKSEIENCLFMANILKLSTLYMYKFNSSELI